MLHCGIPRTRRASAWLVVTALTVLICFLVILPAAMAQSDPSKSTLNKESGAAANASAGQRVAKDPGTGQLREPTPEEVKELEAAQPKKAPLVKKAVKPLVAAPAAAASGAVGMPLDESFESYTVATRDADGTVKFDCVQGKKSAEARVKSGEKTQPATKEASNEK